MVPAIIPLATQVMADFGVGYIVHGGVRMATCLTELTKVQKACVGVAELAIVGVGCNKVNDYIDDTFDKVAKFVVEHDLDKKKKGGGK